MVLVAMAAMVARVVPVVMGSMRPRPGLRVGRPVMVAMVARPVPVAMVVRPVPVV